MLSASVPSAWVRPSTNPTNVSVAAAEISMPRCSLSASVLRLIVFIICGASPARVTREATVAHLDPATHDRRQCPAPGRMALKWADVVHAVKAGRADYAFCCVEVHDRDVRVAPDLQRTLLRIHRPNSCRRF